MMGFLKNALGLREKASWMHIHLVSFVEFSYTYSSSASIAWQSLLTHIDIYWWAFHSPLIRLVDVRLSSPLCLLHNHHSIPPILLCPWLTLRYCVKIEKVWECKKYETIAWLVIGVVHDLNTLCDEDRGTARLYDFVGITFFGHVILRRHNCFVSILEVLLFLCQY